MVVCAARRVSLYFQAHHMIVVISDPLRKILHGPAIVGRLIPYVVELSGFNIEYVLIKGSCASRSIG